MLPPKLPISAEPQPVPHSSSNSLNEKGVLQKGKILSVASLVMASMGILPLIIFVIACLDGIGLGSFICLVVGFVIHIAGSALGFLAIFYGRKAPGLVGLIGNAAILLISILFFLIGLSMSRY